MVAATRQAAKKAGGNKENELKACHFQAAQVAVGTAQNQGSNHSQSTPMPGTGESLTPLSPISSTMPEESFQQKRSRWMQQHHAISLGTCYFVGLMSIDISLAKRWSNVREDTSVHREMETKDSSK